MHICKKINLNIRILKFTGFGILILLITLIISWYIGISKTSWGGWTPPDASLKLNPKEQKWKEKIEKTFNCVITYIGLDDSYREDSIIYLTITYRENSILKTKLNTQIKDIGASIAKTFHQIKKRKQQYFSICFTYKHNYNQDLLYNNIPEDRIYTFDYKNKKSLPLKKSLIVSKFGYFDFFNGYLIHRRIGKDKYYYIKNQFNRDSLNENYKINYPYTFRKIESCTKFTTKKPIKIKLKNTVIELFHEYIFYENLCVSSKIIYNYYPKKSDFTYRQLFNEVTDISEDHLNYPKKDKIHLLDSLKKNPYSNKKVIHGVLVDFKGDTTKIPWTINYETSQFEMNYFLNEISK